MNHTKCYPSTTRCLLLAGLLLMGSVAPALAADIVGDWNMTMEFNGNQSLATLSITQNPDGSYSGMWGGSKLSNIKLEGQKLTFDRTIRFGDNEFTMSYAGTVQDGKLTGAWSSDRGEFETNGVKTKPMSPAVGVWDLNYSVGDREITGKLAISQKPDGALAGTWTSQRGESEVSNVQFQSGKLTFDRTVKFNDQEFKMAFAGTVQDSKLTGEFTSDRGEVPVTGTRAGGALIGKWLLTAVSERGERSLLMTVNPDLTGRYEFFFGELPMKDLKLEGNQVTFALETSFGDQTMRLDFKGKIENGVLKGQMTSDRGTTDITGKKLPPVGGAAATAGTSPVVGTWEFTRQGRDGTPRTSTLKINPDMTGTYTMRDNPVPISDLKVDGSQVTFKITLSFGGNEFTQEFKGTVEGQTLKGAFISERGEREAVGKKVQ
jgi:hypothetical protein